MIAPAVHLMVVASLAPSTCQSKAGTNVQLNLVHHFHQHHHLSSTSSSSTSEVFLVF